MAAVFKQRVTQYHLVGPDGRTSRCTKNTPGAVSKVVTSREYYGDLEDAFGKRVRVKLCVDKRESVKMLSDLAAQARREKLGLGDRFKKHRNTPMAEHLADYRRHLEAAGDCEEHVKKVVGYLSNVMTGCGFATLWDVSATAVQVFVGKLREEGDVRLPDQEQFTTSEAARVLGISTRSLLRYHRQGALPACGKAPGSGPRKLFHRDALLPLLRAARKGIGAVTANHYIRGAKAFTSWAFKNHRIDYDPLSSLATLHEEDDLRHRRRTLSQPDFERFLEAALTGSPFRGLAGTDRFVLYNLAATTGLRASELESLSPASFSLDGEAPVVTVAAKVSKHRKEDVQPLHPEAAAMMRGYMEGREPTLPLWQGSWVSAASEMVQTDLAVAGIPYEDGEGRVFDFHAIRAQFVTSLSRAGVHPKIAQILARHSDIRLTMKNYTYLDHSEVVASLNRLPVPSNTLTRTTTDTLTDDQRDGEAGAGENGSSSTTVEGPA